jgi:hypothetical protein
MSTHGRSSSHPANREADFAKLYPYASLQDGELRVLELEPGKWADPLACRIKHVALKDCGRHREKYKALSYVWAPVTPILRSISSDPT